MTAASDDPDERMIFVTDFPLEFRRLLSSLNLDWLAKPLLEALLASKKIDQMEIFVDSRF